MPNFVQSLIMLDLKNLVLSQFFFKDKKNHIIFK